MVESLNLQTISAWAWQPIILLSPNGKYRVALDEGAEICMGGPVVRDIVFSTGQKLSGCGGSAMWSIDSNYFAFTHWSFEPNNRTQYLCYMEIKSWVCKRWPEKSGPINITGFGCSVSKAPKIENTKPSIEAIISPLTSNKTVNLQLDDSRWKQMPIVHADPK